MTCALGAWWRFYKFYIDAFFHSACGESVMYSVELFQALHSFVHV